MKCTTLPGGVGGVGVGWGGVGRGGGRMGWGGVGWGGGGGDHISKISNVLVLILINICNAVKHE